jgi:hypothetical protein
LRGRQKDIVRRARGQSRSRYRLGVGRGERSEKENDSREIGDVLCGELDALRLRLIETERESGSAGLEAVVKRFLFLFSLWSFHFPSSTPLTPLSSSVLLSFFSYHHSLIALFLLAAP